MLDLIISLLDTSSAAFLPLEMQGLSWCIEDTDAAHLTSALKQWKEPSLGNLWIQHAMQASKASVKVT